MSLLRHYLHNHSLRHRMSGGYEIYRTHETYSKFVISHSWVIDAINLTVQAYSRFQKAFTAWRIEPVSQIFLAIYTCIDSKDGRQVARGDGTLRRKTGKMFARLACSLVCHLAKYWMAQHTRKIGGWRIFIGWGLDNRLDIVIQEKQWANSSRVSQVNNMCHVLFLSHDFAAWTGDEIFTIDS